MLFPKRWHNGEKMDGTLFLLSIFGLVTLGSLLSDKAILYLLIFLFAVPLAYVLAISGAFKALFSLFPRICLFG